MSGAPAPGIFFNLDFCIYVLSYVQVANHLYISEIMKFIVSILLIVISGTLYAESPVYFQINNVTDTSYLLYNFQITAKHDRVLNSAPVTTPIVSFYDTLDGVYTQYLTHAKNPVYNLDFMAQVTTMNMQTMQAYDDFPLKGKIVDMTTFYSNMKQTTGIGLTVDYNDSSFVYIYYPADSVVTGYFLLTGEDQTGDETWQSYSRFVLCKDYDFDGRIELFIYAACGRDFPQRTLHCFEPETMNLEWSLPIASPTYWEVVYSAEDSLNPGIVMITSNPNNGATDDNFSDRYKYLLRIDDSGNIVYKKEIGKDYTSLVFCQDSTDMSYFITHKLPIDSDEQLTTDTTIFLSRLSPTFAVEKQIETAPLISLSRVYDYARKQDALLAVAADRRIMMFTKDLECVMFSQPVNASVNLGQLQLAGEKYPSYLLAFSGKVELYSPEFEKLMSIDGIAPTKIKVLEQNDGAVSKLLLSRDNLYLMGVIHKKHFSEFIKIFFWQHQNKLYMILSALIVGLILLVVNRQKTRKNIEIIRSQKEEIESTYRELQQTQEKLIEAEKFKQAKEIAGGFAHEIRNALFPAVQSLQIFKRLADEHAVSLQSVDTLSFAVNRTLKLVDIISSYTNIESLYQPSSVSISKIVAQVLLEYEQALQNQGIKIDVEGDADTKIIINDRQFYTIVANLLLNSLDALKDMPHGEILISWTEVEKYAKMEFKDNGTGIPLEKLPRIFDTFYSTKPSKGIGMGLSMVKKIVEMYDGSVSVNSAMGKGTAFTFTFMRSVK